MMSGQNPLAPLSDDDLIAEHSQHPLDKHYLTEIVRRHKLSSERLGNRVWWLNVVICLLTAVLVWTAFRDTSVARSRSAMESPLSSAPGAWIVWISGPITTPWWAFWRATQGWSWEGAVATQGECIAAIAEAERMRIDSWREVFGDRVQSRTWIFSQLRRSEILVWMTDDNETA